MCTEFIMYYTVLHEFWNNKKYDSAVPYSVKRELILLSKQIPTFVNDAKNIKWHSSWLILLQPIQLIQSIIYTKYNLQKSTKLVGKRWTTEKHNVYRKVSSFCFLVDY